MAEIINYLLSGVTIGGLIIWGVKLYFESQIKQAQREKAERDEREKLDQQKKEAREIEYTKIRSSYDHAVGRFVFWLYRGITELDPDHQFFNGELLQAYNDFKAAENKIKEFEQQIIAEHNT